ncbi:NACHT domain-containing protein [Candidatus Halobeggiatoa sp. HSG11]|nr:NACHT domain-containing protein [Candidatus Halobeggiatoa sp. HSG11]
MNIILTVLFLAIITVSFIANPHWFSYLRRRWFRFDGEADVAGWQQDYFVEFDDLLTRLNLPLGYSDKENIAQSGKLVEPLYWVLKEMARGENLSFLTAHAALSRQDNKLTRNIVSTLFRSEEPLVLLGDPGSGKSVTLRQIGLQLAERMKNSKAPLIPIYLPLNTFTLSLHSGDAVRQFVDNTLLEQFGEDLGSRICEQLDTLLVAGQVVFLFDSMDEMPRADYGARFEVLKQFADRYSGRNKFIFACRKLDYRERFESRKVIIDLFSRGQIKRFLKNMGLVDWKVLYKQLIDRKLGYRELAENPFFLKLIAMFWRERGKLPENQTVLFQEFSRFLLRKKLNFNNKEYQLYEYNLNKYLFSIENIDPANTSHIMKQVLIAEVRFYLELYSSYSNDELLEYTRQKLLGLLQGKSLSKPHIDKILVIVCRYTKVF